MLDGVKLRSKLEKKAYQLLTEADLDFEYEPMRFTILNSTKFPYDSYERVKYKGKNEFKLKSKTVPKISYKPDFVGDWWIMETKGYETPEFRIRWKLFKKFLTENNLKYTLFKPHTEKEIKECISIIKRIENEKEKSTSSKECKGTNPKVDGRKRKVRKSSKR